MATIPDSLSAAVTQVRSIVGEPTQAFWTDTELENWVKEGCVDICAKTLCLQGVDNSQAVNDNVIEENEPSKCIKVRAAQFYDSQASPVSYRGLQKIYPRYINHLPINTDGDPYQFYHFADRVGVYPLPASMHASDRIVIYYAYTSDTITDLPDKYQVCAVWYAAAMAFFKERKNQEGMAFYNKYLAQMRFLRADLGPIREITDDMMQAPDRIVEAQ